MDIAELVTSIGAALPDVLIALDFDGTLAPLVADPDASRPVAGTLDALTALSARGAELAVITGRDAQTVLRLSGFAAVPGLTVDGLYGAESWRDGVLSTPDTPVEIDQLRTRLPALLNGADSAVWIEDKRLSLVVHARRAADPDAALAPLQDAVQRLADELGLEMHPGRDVLELRLPGFDKAGALHQLVDQQAAILYCGDDLGDLPAFNAIRSLRASGRTAYSVAVLSSGVASIADAADCHVDDPAAIVALLTAISVP